MKKTKLYEIHKSLGANMINFAGFKMPISYGSIINEHKSVRLIVEYLQFSIKIEKVDYKYKIEKTKNGMMYHLIKRL